MSMAQERRDTLAYLEGKIAKAGNLIDGDNDREGNAAAMRRAWEIARDDIKAGLHEGLADA